MDGLAHLGLGALWGYATVPAFVLTALVIGVAGAALGFIVYRVARRRTPDGLVDRNGNDKV